MLRNGWPESSETTGRFGAKYPAVFTGFAFAPAYYYERGK